MLYTKTGQPGLADKLVPGIQVPVWKRVASDGSRATSSQIREEDRGATVLYYLPREMMTESILLANGHFLKPALVTLNGLPMCTVCNMEGIPACIVSSL